jgi:hypothetical protein
MIAAVSNIVFYLHGDEIRKQKRAANFVDDAPGL